MISTRPVVHMCRKHMACMQWAWSMGVGNNNTRSIAGVVLVIFPRYCRSTMAIRYLSYIYTSRCNSGALVARARVAT